MIPNIDFTTLMLNVSTSDIKKSDIIVIDNGFIRYNANLYKCKDCSRTVLEKNPFTFSGFNSSFLLLQSAMKMLANLNYTLSMISEELNISSTQLSKYIASLV